MGVVDDAREVLRFLANYQKEPGDPKKGRYVLSGPQLKIAMGLPPERLNDAVDILAESGQVRVLRGHGTGPYGFAEVVVLAKGRADVEGVPAVAVAGAGGGAGGGGGAFGGGGGGGGAFGGGGGGGGSALFVALGERSAPAPGDAAHESKGDGPWSTAKRVGKWLLLDEHLGDGGQGAVTLVVHAETLTRGALKRMAGKRALTEKGRERFVREMEAFQQVRHPFVVRVLDAADDPEPYLVTQVADFGSLYDNRDAFRGDMWRCLRMARSVALGLAAAHAAGIVHRDIKPKNILVHSLDHPLVADFGVAHFADKEAITSLGSNPGAFHFAPVEYEYHDVDPTPAFDVFSLGAVLHWAFVGKAPPRPYRAFSQLDPVGGAGIDAQRLRVVDDLIARMTQRETKDRMQTMEDVVAALDRVSRRLFGSAAGPMACSCGDGTFADVGVVRLTSGPDAIAIYPPVPPGGSSPAYELRVLDPHLDRCSSCGALRLRATKDRP